MKKISVILLWIFVCASCRRDGHVEGHVYSEGSNEPVKDAEVIVSQSHHYNSDPNIAFGRTDMNGYFNIYFNYRSPGYQHYITVKSDLAYGEVPKKRISKKGSIDLIITTGIPVKFTIKNNLADRVRVIINEKAYLELDAQQKGYINTRVRDFGETTCTWRYYNLNTKTGSPPQKITFAVQAKIDTLFQNLEIQ